VFSFATICLYLQEMNINIDDVCKSERMHLEGSHLTVTEVNSDCNINYISCDNIVLNMITYRLKVRILITVRGVKETFLRTFASSKDCWNMKLIFQL